MKKFFSKKFILPVVAAVIFIAVLLQCLSFFTLSPLKYAESRREQGVPKIFDDDYFALEDGNRNILYAGKNSGRVFFKTPFSAKEIPSTDGEAFVSEQMSTVVLSLADKKGNVFKLDSENNSASFGAFRIAQENEEITVSYNMYKDEKSFLEDNINNVTATVSVVFGTENGRFKVSVDISKTKISKEYTLTGISLLPGLFNVTAGTNLNNLYYILPENSGYILALGAQNGSEKKTLSFDAYCKKNGENRKAVSVPYASFGNGEVLATVVPGNGSALCSFDYTSENGAFSLVPSFSVTSCGKNVFGIKKGAKYNGEISVDILLCKDGVNAYNTAATQVRSFYRERGFLKDGISEEIKELPFIISTVGSVNGKKNKTLTNFEDASEMITLLSSKGVRSVFFRFAGALKHGLYQTQTDVTELNTALGSEADFKEMLSVFSGKNSKVFLESELLTSKNIGTFIDGTPASNDFYAGNIKDIIKAEYKNRGLSDEKTFNGNVSALFTTASKYAGLGVSLHDVVTAFPFENKKDRNALCENAKEKLASLNVNSLVMMSSPAVCYLKNTDVISNIFTSQYSFESGVQVIPFTQMVLHGSVVYGGDYINFGDGWSNILKSIEYGAVPSFVFTHNKCENLSYGEYASLTAKYYTKLKNLKSVLSLPMTSHEKISDGVYKVTYGYSKLVYINYTGSVQTVEGVVLSPNDFLLV